MVGLILGVGALTYENTTRWRINYAGRVVVCVGHSSRCSETRRRSVERFATAFGVGYKCQLLFRRLPFARSLAVRAYVEIRG